MRRYLNQKAKNSLRLLQGNMAFSMVELSVVIAIIGLLLAGITQGSSLFSLSEMMYLRSYSANAPFLKKDSLTLWLDAAQENAFASLVGASYVSMPTAANGIRIQRWNDVKTGQQPKIHISQSTLANRATHLRKGINGLPALSFDGGDSYSASSISPLQLFSDGKASIFIVQNFNSLTAANSFSWNFGNAAQNVVISNTSAGALTFKFAADTATTAAGAVAVARPAILSFVKNLNAITIKANGANMLSAFSYTGRLNSNATASVVVGSSFRGTISEIIVFRDALSDNDVSDIENYLSEKWKIALVKSD